MLTVPIFKLRASSSPLGQQVGVVYIDDARRHNLGYGVAFRVVLSGTGLPDGPHGFHLHEKPDLRATRKGGELVTAGAAGPHYDPAQTGTHRGPYGSGHPGDLPRVHSVGGDIDDLVVAPRLMLADCFGRAIIVHLGGDNYTDSPPNGGGKARALGGVIIV